MIFNKFIFSFTFSIFIPLLIRNDTKLLYLHEQLSPVWPITGLGTSSTDPRSGNFVDLGSADLVTSFADISVKLLLNPLC